MLASKVRLTKKRNRHNDSASTNFSYSSAQKFGEAQLLDDEPPSPAFVSSCNTNENPLERRSLFLARLYPHSLSEFLSMWIPLFAPPPKSFLKEVFQNLSRRFITLIVGRSQIMKSHHQSGRKGRPSKILAKHRAKFSIKSSPVDQVGQLKNRMLSIQNLL